MFTTPVIRALKRAYPEAHLAYVVEPAAEPLVANNPCLDEVIVARRRRGVHRLLDDVRLARRLRQARYDLAIDLHGGPRSAWLAWASAAPERIGYDIQGRRWMYTRIVHRSREHRPRHSVVNQWDLLQAIPGWVEEDPSPDRNPVEMALDGRADARMAERLRDAGVARDGRPHRGARERRQPVSTVAGSLLRRPGRASCGREDHSTAGVELRSFRSGSGGQNRGRGASTARRIRPVASSISASSICRSCGR